MRTHIGDSAVLESLVDRIGRARPDCRRRWGTMDVQQMLVHIGDATAAVTGQRPFSAGPRSGPPICIRTTIWANSGCRSGIPRAR